VNIWWCRSTCRPPATSCATADKPYLLLNIELDPQEIAAIVLEAHVAIDTQEPVRGAYIGKTDDALQESLYQLVRLLQAPPAEAAFLAVGLKREIIYRMLTGAYGRQLYHNIVLDQQDRGISKAIAWLKDRYDQPVKVEELAQATHMSVSSLHHRFKAVTTMGPMQYQKQLRLAAGACAAAGRRSRCHRRLQGRLRKRLAIQPRVPPPVRRAAHAGHKNSGLHHEDQ
jgi:AraC-like DNA-binding protein